jgi:hypothetical protein
LKTKSTGGQTTHGLLEGAQGWSGFQIEEFSHSFQLWPDAAPSLDATAMVGVVLHLLSNRRLPPHAGLGA